MDGTSVISLSPGLQFLDSLSSFFASLFSQIQEQRKATVPNTAKLMERARRMSCQQLMLSTCIDGAKPTLLFSRSKTEQQFRRNASPRIQKSVVSVCLWGTTLKKHLKFCLVIQLEEGTRQYWLFPSLIWKSGKSAWVSIKQRQVNRPEPPSSIQQLLPGSMTFLNSSKSFAGIKMYEVPESTIARSVSKSKVQFPSLASDIGIVQQMSS